MCKAEDVGPLGAETFGRDDGLLNAKVREVHSDPQTRSSVGIGSEPRQANETHQSRMTTGPSRSTVCTPLTPLTVASGDCLSAIASS